MSLDLLALVATETLEREPNRKRSAAPNAQIPLSQISQMSSRVLVKSFAELDGDELTRKYTYRCYLMPDKCSQLFHSFGNEDGARVQVRDHLLKHVKELVAGGSSFYAETVTQRKKRLKPVSLRAVKKRAPTRGAINSKKNPLNSPPSPKNLYTVLVPPPKTLLKNKQDKPVQAIKAKVPAEFIYNQSLRKLTAKPFTAKTGNKDMQESIMNRSNSPEKHGSHMEAAPSSKPCEKRSPGNANKSSAGSVNTVRKHSTVETDPSSKKTFSNSKLSHSDIINNLSQVQPFLDHCYTTVFGPVVTNLEKEELYQRVTTKQMCNPRVAGMRRPYIADTLDLKDMSSSKQKSLLNKKVKSSTLELTSLDNQGSADVATTDVCGVPLPIHHTHMDPDHGETQPVYKWDSHAADANRSHNKGPALLDDTSGDEDTESTTSLLNNQPSSSADPIARVIDNIEYERKLALACIRELKSKKKEDPLLVCKICKDRSFTAAATLMYHYRSHAGIKPFVCLICNTTFTRQHSLNYHMLIHNNQSRFTCLDCGRKFRHPSHFKEHLRRHTGETPYHCTDCPVRFKTRNTYKRHLRTRHGKVLTAKGIRPSGSTMLGSECDDDTMLEDGTVELPELVSQMQDMIQLRQSSATVSASLPVPSSSPIVAGTSTYTTTGTSVISSTNTITIDTDTSVVTGEAGLAPQPSVHSTLLSQQSQQQQVQPLIMNTDKQNQYQYVVLGAPTSSNSDHSIHYGSSTSAVESMDRTSTPHDNVVAVQEINPPAYSTATSIECSDANSGVAASSGKSSMSVDASSLSGTTVGIGADNSVTPVTGRHVFIDVMPTVSSSVVGPMVQLC